MLGNKKGNPKRPVRPFQPPAHCKPVGNRGKSSGKLLQVYVKPFKVPLNPHEEEFAFRILMLVRMKDVGIVPGEKIRNTCHNSFLVRTVYQQNRGALHRWSRWKVQKVNLGPGSPNGKCVRSGFSFIPARDRALRVAAELANESGF